MQTPLGFFKAHEMNTVVVVDIVHESESRLMTRRVDGAEHIHVGDAIQLEPEGCLTTKCSERFLSCGRNAYLLEINLANVHCATLEEFQTLVARMKDFYWIDGYPD